MVHVLGSDPADAAYSGTGFRRLPYSRTSTTRVPAPRSAPQRDHEANRRPSAPAQPTYTAPSLSSFLEASNPPARPPIGCPALVLARRAGSQLEEYPRERSAWTDDADADARRLPSWRISIIGIKNLTGGSAGGRMAPCTKALHGDAHTASCRAPTAGQERWPRVANSRPRRRYLYRLCTVLLNSDGIRRGDRSVTEIRNS